MKRFIAIVVLGLAFFASSTSFASTVADDAKTSFIVADDLAPSAMVVLDANDLTVDYEYLTDTSKKATLVRVLAFERKGTDYEALKHRHKSLYSCTIKIFTGFSEHLTDYRKPYSVPWHKPDVS